MSAVAYDLGPGPDLTPEVVSQCACGRPHTRETFQKLQLATSATHSNGQLRHEGETYEFRLCQCGSTIAAKL